MRKGDNFSTATQSAGAAATAPAKEKAERQDREARIADLREQYLAGTYKVDAAELSRKLVDSHLRSKSPYRD
jgi:anti-sigma28 factor (negative regulator of flagellin synthesis)